MNHAGSCLVSRFVPKSEFSSYEEFKSEFRIDIPENFNFAYDVVDHYALTQPEKVALVWLDDKGDEQTFTFADLKHYSDKTANLLQTLGIGKGDPVMLIAKRRYEFWFMLIALHKLGAVAVPASHMLTARDISYRCNAADIRAIFAIADERIASEVEEAEKSSPTLNVKILMRGTREGWHSFDEELTKSSDSFARPTGADATTNDDTSVLFFTSGTTGLPKMVEHDFTYPLGHIITAAYWQNCEDGGLHLTVADTGWAKFAWGKIYGQWISGCAVFVYDYDHKFEPKKLLQVLDDYQITSFCAPSTIFRMMLMEDCSKYDLKHLKDCVCAGEPLYPEVYNKILEVMGLRLREGFGQSETVVAIANFPWMEGKPGSMGKPSPTYDIAIIDDEGNLCGDGEQGHVVYKLDGSRPAGMFCRYHRNQELTDKAFRDGLYYTGDIAYRDEDGYYWYVCRADDTIKSSGYKIGPFEVESVLQEHPAVHECAVTGVPDPIRGQIVKATIVLAADFEPSDVLAKELQDFVKHNTAPYKYPRLVEFVDALPRTHSGKVSRNVIRKTDQEKVAKL